MIKEQLPPLRATTRVLSGRSPERRNHCTCLLRAMNALEFRCNTNLQAPRRLRLRCAGQFGTLRLAIRVS